MRKLNQQAIKDIAVGAAVLGTGGGGDPYVGMLMALQAVEEYGDVEMITIDDVPDDALVVPTAMMGAPTVLTEKVPSGDEIMVAFETIKNHLHQDVFATLPIEAGGVNSMIPLAVASTLGIPFIDADGMGRAFPELQMVTFTLHDIPATPMISADEKGNKVLYETVDNSWTERLARACCVEMGGSVMNAIYPMTGAQVKAGSIPGIVTLTEEIGKVIRLAKEKRVDPVESVIEITGGFELFRGKAVDIERRTDGGFVRGRSEFEGTGDYKGEHMELLFQNENLIARTDERLLATAPDLIAVLDQETGKPITTEGLRYGARGVVIGIPANEQWRTEEGIKLVGPRYFGYDFDFTPVEELVKQNKRKESEA